MRAVIFGIKFIFGTCKRIEYGRAGNGRNIRIDAHFEESPFEISRLVDSFGMR